MLMSHPLDVLDVDSEKFYRNLDTSRCFIMFSIILHFGIHTRTHTQCKRIMSEFIFCVRDLNDFNWFICSCHINELCTSWSLDMGTESIYKYGLVGYLQYFVSILWEYWIWCINHHFMSIYQFSTDLFSHSFRIIIQTFIFILSLVIYDKIRDQLSIVWPIVLLLIGSLSIVFIIVELCKWQELK